MINIRYQQSVQLIESLINNPGPNYLKTDQKNDRSFFIKRLKFLLNSLGNPEKSFKYIHIAGTSGKSSLTAMIQSILTESNIKTGAYFSPHPSETYERIKTGKKYISPNDFAKLTNFLKPHLSKCASKSPHGIPSYFETLLALAFLYFKKQKCKYVILETGLGGAFDATNIISKSEIAIITKIDLDHTDILGKSRKKIARDKAGIIKKNSLVITAEQDPKNIKIFQNICNQKKSKFHQVNLDYKIIKNDLSGTKFKYQNKIYQTRLSGEHQIQNAILAIETIKQYNLQENLTIEEPAIKLGLSNAFLPCRLEIVKHHPIVILDSAHNPDKMKTTAKFIKNIKHNRLHLIFTLAENKDLYNTLKYIIPFASHVYLTRFLIPSRKMQDLKNIFKTAKKLTRKPIQVYIDPKQALASALHKAKKNDIVLVTGSFFLAGELRKKQL